MTVREILVVLIRYGLSREFADAVDDPGRLFGMSVSQTLIDDVNAVRRALDRGEIEQ